MRGISDRSVESEQQFQVFCKHHVNHLGGSKKMEVLFAVARSQPKHVTVSSWISRKSSFRRWGKKALNDVPFGSL